MTDAERQRLLEEAWKGREQSYSPYSHFPVGAAVLGEDGTIYRGCNIENASYGASNCAERTAIFQAAAQGCRKIRALAVVGAADGPTWPCGICRQVMREFGSADMEILIGTGKTTYLLYTLEELLPHAFGPEALKK